MNCSLFQRFAFSVSIFLLTIAVVAWILIRTVSKPFAIQPVPHQ